MNSRVNARVRKVLLIIVVGCGLAFSGGAAAIDTTTFNFAAVGTSFSAFLPPDSPLVGQEIIAARIYLDVDAESGAANFFTDIAFPIDPFAGNENALVLSGADFGWSGAGTFHFFEQTTGFNGIFVATRWGAETPGEDFSGTILAGSRIEFDYAPQAVPEPGTVLFLAIGAVAMLARRKRWIGRSPGTP
jgi:hypothetical protein